uniref:oleate hydratase n=1 Tax=Thiolapillus sp. TaxID=2017437 RepID=UPI003AF7F54A
MEKRDANKANIYLVGSGIASLASAVYLVKDAGVEGNRIHVMEQRDIAGGALDGSGEESEGYLRCQPWRAKRRLVVPSSREAALFSRRALRQRENKVGLRTR